MASTASLWHLVLIVLAILNVKQTFCAPHQVPCYFSFGDSIVDNGNNNNLLTTAKANYPPYGVDFPKGATGRFTNGRNLADFIAQLLGFTDFIPPYALVRDRDIIRGVNYGSGTAGIRDETGFVAGERFSFNQQLLNHATTVLRIAFSCRNLASLQKHLRKCLYTVVIGSNDYLNNYFSPGYPTSRIYTPDQYAAALIRQYSKQLEVLYNLGARKVALGGLGSALGCIPALRNAGGRNSCVDSINAAAELFNKRLRPLVDDLNQRLPNAKFIYLNASSILSGDPRALGIQVLDKPCCRVSSTTGLCIRNSVPCSNRTQYAFYDAVHPTSVVYENFAKRAYNSVLSSDAYPMDISHLVRWH